MHTTISWAGGMAFDVDTGSGHRIRIDGPPDLGGENTGPRPMELMLASLGSCSAVDVVHILRRSRADVRGCTVEVQGTRAETDPKVFTSIHLEFVISGDNLREGLVDRAVRLSAEKYCSAARMLEASCTITHAWRMAPEGEH
ncbi:MAG: OsmC family protein [Oceanococcaceae bacterium]